MSEHKFQNDAGLVLTLMNEGEYPKEYVPIMGGLDTNPTWEEYLSDFKENFKPHLELVKKAIEEMGWVGKTGEEICNYWYYSFSDGTNFGFSWRAWGDLMQAIVGKREGYMAYYM